LGACRNRAETGREGARQDRCASRRGQRVGERDLRFPNDALRTRRPERSVAVGPSRAGAAGVSEIERVLITASADAEIGFPA
jgi:hypothetical protein